MFANNRIISAIGFTNIPNNSIGAKNNFIGMGSPGIHNICFQYCPLLLKIIITKVTTASARVKEIFPLRLLPKGKNGISPKILLTHIKKKRVNKKGMYFL